MATSRSAGESGAASAPSKRTTPDVGSSSPAIVRRSVVLPAPVGPSTTRSSSLATSRSMPPSAVVLPKRFVSDRSERNGSSMALVSVVAPRASIEEVKRREIEREAQRRADRVAFVRAHDDAAVRRADVRVTMRPEVLVENHLAAQDAGVVGAHVLGPDAER